MVLRDRPARSASSVRSRPRDPSGRRHARRNRSRFRPKSGWRTRILAGMSAISACPVEAGARERGRARASCTEPAYQNPRVSINRSFPGQDVRCGEHCNPMGNRKIERARLRNRMRMR